MSKVKDMSWEEAFLDKDGDVLKKKIIDTVKDFRSFYSNTIRDIGVGHAFYRGNHYGEWSDESLSFKEDDINEDDRPRLVVNLTKMYVEQVVSKVVRYKPSVMTTPQGNDKPDIEGSKCAEQLLHHEFNVNDMTDLVERLVREASIGQIGWFYLDWDPDKGDKIDEDKKEGKTYAGDHIAKVAMGNDIVWDDSCGAYWKDAKWAIRIYPADPVALKAKFPKMAKKIKADKSKQDYSGAKTTSSEQINSTTVYELFHVPTNCFETGGRAIVCEAGVLKKSKKKYPFKHKKLPFVPLIYSTVNDFLCGSAIPQDIMHLQVEYDKIKNVKLENQNYACGIKFLNPLSSNYDADLMTNLPGEVINYDGPTPPGWSQPQVVSEELQTSLTEINEEMAKIIGVNQTSQGKPPEGIRSGIAIQYLIENDDVRFAPFIRRVEKCVTVVAQMWLSNMKQYYADEDDRYYKVIGDNKSFQLKQFKLVDFEGRYDVIVQNSNANPLSKAYKMDTIMQLIQYQLLGVNDRPFVAKQLEIGNLGGIQDDLQLDMTRAEKEIEDILAGKKHDFLEYDDHEEHRMTKIRYIKRENLDPKQRQLIIGAIKEHEAFMQKQQAQLEQANTPPQEGAPQQEQPPQEAGMSPQAIGPMGGEI